MDERIEFIFGLKRYDRVYVATGEHPIIHMRSREYWRKISINPILVKTYKVLYITRPATQFSPVDRAKAHYKFLRHYHKKSEKLKRFEK